MHIQHKHSRVLRSQRGYDLLWFSLSSSSLQGFSHVLRMRYGDYTPESDWRSAIDDCCASRCSRYIGWLLAIVKHLSGKERSHLGFGVFCVWGKQSFLAKPWVQRAESQGSSLRLAVRCDCNLAQVLKKCPETFFSKTHILYMVRIRGCTDADVLNSLQTQFRDILSQWLVYFHECSCMQAARRWRLLK